MKSMTPSRISIILIVAALLLQQFALSMAFHGRLFVLTCLWLGTLALVLRAVAEVKRPVAEWGWGLLWALGIAIIYSLICPAWAHTAQLIGLHADVMSAFKAHLFAFALNLLVPLGKIVAALVSRSRA